MTTVEHGFNLKAIRFELSKEDWQEDIDNPGQEIRRLYLGDVFSLTPSGKMYMPFACSNLTPCATCKGSGRTVLRRLKRRTQKKHASRHAYVMRRFDCLYGALDGIPSLGIKYRKRQGRDRPQREHAAYAFIDRQPKRYRLRYLAQGSSSCTACNGMGSREAYLDELWNEAAEEAIGSIEGVFLSWENGDAFACETRETPEDEKPDTLFEDIARQQEEYD